MSKRYRPFVEGGGVTLLFLWRREKDARALQRREQSRGMEREFKLWLGPMSKPLARTQSVCGWVPKKMAEQSSGVASWTESLGER